MKKSDTLKFMREKLEIESGLVEPNKVLQKVLREHNMVNQIKLKKIIITLTVLIFCCASCLTNEQIVRKSLLKNDFRGIVKDAFLSSELKGHPIVVFMDESINYTGSPELCCYVEPGDSIIKEKGFLKVRVYRNSKDSVFYPRYDKYFLLENDSVKYCGTCVTNYCHRTK